MRKFVVSLWLLNLWDAVATWYAVVVAGYAYEYNTSMAWAIQKGAITFFGLKIGAMTAICWALDRHAQEARWPIFAAVFTYGLIAAWHVYTLLAWR